MAYKRKIPETKLDEIKENIRGSHDYFLENIDRYHEFKKFVFQTSLSPDDETKLNILKKPVIEFNILEAQINRLIGEFAKHEPNLTIEASEGTRIEDLTEDFIKLQKIVEAHIRSIIFAKTNDAISWKIYKDLLGGGFSVVKVFTDYINEMSFDQNIKYERVFDPTLTGFDPLARESHKGDGMFCYQLYPQTKEEFEKDWGKDATDGLKFTRTTQLENFNWSYSNQNKDIVLLAEYFYKVRTKQKIMKLSNGHVIMAKHYKDFLEIWNSGLLDGIIEQAPIPLEERMTTIESIERVIICENKILKEDKTKYSYLPLIFIDGNSEEIRECENGAATQMTRPYVYQARGIQQLKNFSGQTIGAEIENMLQHKWIVPKEAIPPEYIDAYKNPQQASSLVYYSFLNGDPNIPLQAPREVQRTPTPPIVENTFNGTDRTTQVILGNYDSVLGTNDKQISGIAIQQGALQSNAAAMPYLMGYIKGLTRVGQIILDLIPKYYVTPRSMPLKMADGKRSVQFINQPNNPESIDMYYKPNSLHLQIDIGVSAAVQKQVALEQIILMMQSSQEFNEFVNQMGLEIILDNMDIRGIDDLKSKSVIFMENKKKQAEEAAQKGDPQLELAQQQMQSLTEIEMAKIEQQAEKTEGDHAIQAAKVAIEKQNSDIKFAEVMAKVQDAETKRILEMEKVDAENARSAVETALSIHKHHREGRKNREIE